MQYQRTYRFSAAHFNSRKAYETAWELAANKRSYLSEALLFALLDIHGHNFRVTVLFDNERPNEEGWLVDDVEIEKVIMEWANINLSMHPDFYHTCERATTELMALKLLRKLEQRWPNQVALVRVYETDDIYAEVEK